MSWIAPLLLWMPTLFDQSLVRILQRDFPSVQFVLVDIPKREVLGTGWAGVEQPIPMGSLMKPFTALASSAGVSRCNPKECWLAAGHGRIGLVDALAGSCNSYFLQISATVSEDRMTSVAERFGIPRPASLTPPSLTGIGSDWAIAPSQLALAYALLAVLPEADTVRKGMRESARSGTAKAIHADALAKTGTAPCVHLQKAPGDGYVAVLYPSQAPRYVLLIQVHGVSGAVAAHTAAEMLTAIRNGK